MRKGLKWLVPAGLLTAAALALTASPASANSLGTYADSGVRIRSTPHTNSPVTYGLGYPGQHACSYFYTTGDNINGDVYWEYNKDLSTGAGPGYSADYYMYPFYYGTSC